MSIVTEDLVKYVLFPLVVILLHHYAVGILDKRGNRRKKTLRISFLCSQNATVKNCMNRYMSTKNMGDFVSGLIIFLSLACGLYTFSYVDSIIQRRIVADDMLVFTSLFNLLFLLLLSFVATGALYYVVNIDISDMIVRIFLSAHKFVLCFILSFNFWLVVFFIGRHISSFNPFSILYIMSILSFITIILSLKHFKNTVIKKFEFMLNDEFYDDFPTITVKSSDINVEGHICDIFNDKLLVLKDNNRLNAISWELIRMLTLIEDDSC